MLNVNNRSFPPFKAKWACAAFDIFITVIATLITNLTKNKMFVHCLHHHGHGIHSHGLHHVSRGHYHGHHHGSRGHGHDYRSVYVSFGLCGRDVKLTGMPMLTLPTSSVTIIRTFVWRRDVKHTYGSTPMLTPPTSSLTIIRTFVGKRDVKHTHTDQLPCSTFNNNNVKQSCAL